MSAMQTSGWVGGFGVVGLGVSSPTPHRTRPDLCAERGHPSVTYNPWSGTSWCLCGERVTDGSHVEFPVQSACGGSLVDCLHYQESAA